MLEKRSNDYEKLAQEQNIALANFRRKKLSQTGIRGSNGNIKYHRTFGKRKKTQRKTEKTREKKNGYGCVFSYY